MSSNMQRQAIKLSRSEKCIVEAGLERQTALDTMVFAKAEHEGNIIYIDTDKIVLSGNRDTYSGKSRIFNGRIGDPFEQPVIIGKYYILKLIHQVDDKIHGRSSGYYALVTQQPFEEGPNIEDNG
ncbi:hypothetical protein Scep_004549 [Stephania cephalantha]|uniref:DNA-directed RNA polymerase n=1 Tax=Stephania cephalantha TaxID=152367 RepID=A0AAP0PWR2_9MAGN